MATGVTAFTKIIDEGSSSTYTVTLQDEVAAEIPAGSIDTLTLTLKNRADDSTINSRLDQDILNANNVTVSGLGVLVFTLQPADTTMVDPLREFETHRATFKMAANSNTIFRNWEVDFTIHNLTQVT